MKSWIGSLLVFQNRGGFEEKADVCVLGGRLIFLPLQNLVIGCRVSLWLVVKIGIVTLSLRCLLFCARRVAFRAVVSGVGRDGSCRALRGYQGWDSRLRSAFVSCHSHIKQLFYLGDLYLLKKKKKVSLEGKGTVGAEVAVTVRWKS